MFRSNPFITELLSVIGGVLILVATIAFITIPYSLERHPGTGTTLAVGAKSFHLT